jgi:hypothetical protein
MVVDQKTGNLKEMTCNDVAKDFVCVQRDV